MQRVRFGRRRVVVAIVVGCAAAVAAGAFTVAVIVRHSLDGRSDQSATSQLVGRHSRPPSSAITPAATTPAANVPTVRDALFVGASYTAGLGADPPTDGYAYVIGRQPGWRVQVDGVSGTGYLNPGPHGGQTFADRIGRLPRTPRPDLIVFQGGRNDVGYPSARLRAAVISTVRLAQHRFHGAQIVLLGPIPAQVPTPRGQLAVESVLRSAAGACHVGFVDPIAQKWITPQNELGYSGRIASHPDNRGYAYIAERLLADLNALFAGGRTS